MDRRSYSIRDIMILVLGAACVLALGRHDSRVWTVGVYPAALLAAVIGSQCGRGRSRQLALVILSSFPILGLLKFASMKIDPSRQFVGLATGSILVAATLGAWILRGETKIFAWAFALSGSVSLGYHAHDVLGQKWMTRPPVFLMILNSYFPILYGTQPDLAGPWPPMKLYSSDEIQYLFIGTCVLSLFTGLCGGILAVWLSGTTRNRPQPAGSTTRPDS